MDFVLENNLFKGKDITSKQIDELSNKSEFDILKSKLLEYIYSKPYSKRELQSKLDTYSRKKYKNKLDKNKFEEIFEYISSKGYYNPLTNISKWVTHYLDKKKGSRYIEQKLAEKGYDQKQIKESIKSLTNIDNSHEVIMNLLSKKIGNITEINQKLKIKVIRYLLAQGFSYDTVKENYKKYLEENNLKEVKEG
ncbi:MAG: RecX family transcriptional regulator [bacterium]